MKPVMDDEVAMIIPHRNRLLIDFEDDEII